MEDDYKEGRQLPGRRCVSLEAAVGYLHSPTPLFFLSIFGFLVAWEWELDVGPAFFFLFLIRPTSVSLSNLKVYGIEQP